MIHADRRGKLRFVSAPNDAAHFESSEDLLTSYVFGLLRYLPWSKGFGPLLGAVGVRIEPDPVPAVEFWPLEQGTEPDVYIEAGGYRILVEAKLYSGFGENQLGREWVWLTRRAGTGNRLLLVVALDRLTEAELREQIARDLQALKATVAPPLPAQVAALTWTRAAVILGERLDAEVGPTRAILEDLRWIFERGGLHHSPFEGWNQLGVQARTTLSTAAWYRETYFRGLRFSCDEIEMWRRSRVQGSDYFGEL